MKNLLILLILSTTLACCTKKGVYLPEINSCEYMTAHYGTCDTGEVRVWQVKDLYIYSDLSEEDCDRMLETAKTYGKQRDMLNDLFVIPDSVTITRFWPGGSDSRLEYSGSNDTVNWFNINFYHCD